MNFIKKFKSAVALITSLALISTVLVTGSFAQTETHTNKYSKGTIKTKEDSQKLFDAAKAGDKDAQEYVASLKVFDKDEVSKALKTIKLSPNNPKQTFTFGDNSQITFEMIDISKEVFEKNKRQLQSVSYVNCYKQININISLLGYYPIVCKTYAYWTVAKDSRDINSGYYSRVTGMNVYQNADWYPPFYANLAGCGVKYPGDVGRYPWLDGISKFNYGFYIPYYFGTTMTVNFCVGWNGGVTFYTTE